jgi:3',5'-cyclic-nucleotide phosphodiesterase
MDYSACNVVYVDRTAKEDRLARRKDSIASVVSEKHAGADDHANLPLTHSSTADGNLRTLLDTFSEGWCIPATPGPPL